MGQADARVTNPNDRMTSQEIKQQAENLADELIESWIFGTDLDERLSEETLEDLREKALLLFEKSLIR